MQKNFDDFSIQEAMRLAQSPAGQELIRLLQQTHSAEIDTLRSQIDSGNYDHVRKSASSLLASEEVQALLKQLRGNEHG